MRRRYPAPVIVGLAVLGACSDVPSASPDMTRTEVSALAQTLPSCDATALSALVEQLSPAGGRGPRYELRGQVTRALASVQANGGAVAQRFALQLAKALGEESVQDLLRDPNGSAAPTKTEAIGQLVGLLFGCVGLEAPPNLPAAYGPYGGVAVIGPEGGDLITEDEGAAIRVPEGAVSSDHLFTITPLSTVSNQVECFPPGTGLVVVGQCYDFSVTPFTTFAVPVRAVICTEPPPGMEHTHNELQIAKEQHTVPVTVKVYDRLSDPFGLDCEGEGLPVSLTGEETTVIGSLWSGTQLVADVLTRPFRPRKAYAADGVGSDFGDFSRAATVYPIVMQNGFENGDAAFTRDGMWIAREPGAVSNAAYPSMVDLASNDGSAGAIPAPHAGGRSMWFGAIRPAVEAVVPPENGNYIGTMLAAPPQAGGTSAAPQSGTLTSPAFYVPVVTNNVQLKFATWWEIEGVNPSGFDLMDVMVLDVSGTSTSAAPVPVVLDRLNPSSDPSTPEERARLPYSNTGFDSAPSWQLVTLDLSAFKGKTVQLQFGFDTRDQLYNGFRGWLVDDILVRTAPQNAPAAVMTHVHVRANSLAEPPAARVWRP